MDLLLLMTQLQTVENRVFLVSENSSETDYLLFWVTCQRGKLQTMRGPDSPNIVRSSY